MATELATGYVSIVPSTKGFQAKLAGQVSGPVGAVGAAAGRSFGLRFSESTKNIGAGVLKNIGKIAKTGGVGAALFVGASLKLGYDRLTTIQNATAQLTNQLGSASKAGKFTQAIVKTVNGTPFNLDQFLDAGSSLVSMGAAADKVPGYLTAIGNVAATKGKLANDFAARLTASFGRAATQGKITGDTLQEMSDAGVPALKILANGFGVSTGEMLKMVSKGLVPADKGLDILTKGIGSGTNGAAGKTIKFAGNMEALRKTTTGAAGGFKSAMARIGAAVLKPGLPLLATAATKGADALDGLTKKVPALIDSLSKSKRVQDILRDIKTVVARIGSAVAKAAVRVRPFVEAFAKFVVHNPKPFLVGLAVVLGGMFAAAVWSAATAVIALLSPFVLIVGAIALVAGGLTLAYQKVGWFHTAVSAVAGFITGTLVPLFAALWGVVSTVFSNIKTVVMGVVNFFTTNWSTISGILTAPFKIAQTVVTTVFDAVKAVVSGVIGWVLGNWSTIQAIITGPIRIGIDIAKGAINGITATFRAVSGAVSGIISGIVGFVTGIPGRITGAVGRITGIINGPFATAKNWVKDRLDEIVGFVTGIPGRIRSVLSGVGDIISAPFKAAGDAIKRLWNSTVGGFGITVPDIPGLPGRGNRYEIPRMHSGGVVPGGRNDEPIYRLQGGEGVVPRSGMAVLEKMFDRSAPTSPQRATSVTGVHADQINIGDPLTAEQFFRYAELKTSMAAL